MSRTSPVLPQQDNADDIAIVGMACRLPAGLNSPAALWDFVSRAGDAVTEIPLDRWDASAFFDPVPGTPGKSYSRWGAFVDDVDGFDHAFFGISARERDTMDPQQRLLMEVTWEALEHGAIAPSSLRNARGGVYVGISSFDHVLRQLRGAAADLNHGFIATGSSHAVAAGRLSYFLGLTGPALSVDTACSSALVSVHQGVRALRHGEIEIAVCGAVSLTLLPEGNIILSQARMLSPTGRCRAFADDADGYVRGEGCGVVILRRLRDALRDGQRVLAVIRGTATNQDGRSSGLTAPSGAAQADLIRAALADARLTPGDIDAVEAHGTGTALGDPIELRALGQVFGETEREHPLVVSSVKTNIGHLESAAGIAGLIRAVEGLRRAQVAPHLHFGKPMTAVEWSRLPLRVPTRLEPWPTDRGIRRTGVSSFGFSGTNAHVVLESWSNDEQSCTSTDAADDCPQVLVLSAATKGALDETCNRLADHLEARPDVRLADVAFTLGAGRSALAERVAIVVRDRDTASHAIRRLACGDPEGIVVRSRHASGVAPLVAFAFPGQGAQFVGMARLLSAQEPVFHNALTTAVSHFDSLLPASLLDVMHGVTDDASIDDTLFTQPALFAVGVALATWWKARGVHPGVLLGHSIGEYAAAYMAGVFSLSDAARLVAARARLMAALPKTGGMLSVFAPLEQVLPYIRDHRHLVDVGAVNGPEHSVLSGDATTLGRLNAEFQRQGLATKPLMVSHAFHSPMVESMLEDFRREVESVELCVPHTTLVSNLNGKVVTHEVTDSDYWCRHVRQPVQFDASVTCLHELGVRVVLEAGPSAVLSAMGKRTRHGKTMRWIPSLAKGRDDRDVQLEAVAHLFSAGCALDWSGIVRSEARRIDLPLYPFQHDIRTESRTPFLDGGDQPDRWMLREVWVADEGSTRTLSPQADFTGEWRLWGVDARAVAVVAAKLRELGGSAESNLSNWGEPRRWRGTIILLGENERHGSSRLPDFGELSDVTMQLHSLLSSLNVDGTRTWFVTCGAHAVEDSLVQPLQSGLWAIAGVVAREFPEFNIKRLDLGRFEDEDLSSLAAALLRDDGEDRLAIRRGMVKVARLLPATPDPTAASIDLRTDAAYLVTGGLGALGMVMAEWLVSKGVAHVVLASRRQPDAELAKRLETLGAAGTRISVLNADVTDAGAFADALERALMGGAPLRGIVHAAGVLDDSLFRDLTRERLERVVRPKVMGAASLLSSIDCGELDFVIFYSSIASLLGSPGQANYALANGVLDGLAQRLSAEGLRVTSINWCSWTGAGMAARLDPRYLRRQRAAGVGSLTPEQGVKALEHVLSAPHCAQIAVVPLHVGNLASVTDPYFGQIAQRGERRDPETLQFSWAAVPKSEIVPALVGWLQVLLGDVLGTTATAIEPDRSIMELGLDSLGAMEVRNRVQTEVGCCISVAALLHGPTIVELAQLLAAELQRVSTDSGPVNAGSPGSDGVRDLEILEF